MSAKSKSAIPGTTNTKSSPATPRISRVAKPSGDSVSPLLNGRNSVDRSPGSVTPKIKVERPSPKPSTPTDRKATRLLRPSSELQAELNQVQEELKKANEKLAFIEKEKAKAVDEAKEALRLCNEANEKLEEVFLAQKRAEENSEIEKFRALEMEQVGIEATNVEEDEWVKELEAVRSQHAVDVAALLSATQELQKVKQELTMTSAAKNQALNHADDATKIAEIHAEKVEVLSAEVIHLKSALESRVDMQAIESNKLVSDLKLEINHLKQELERVKRIEEKLADKEASLEKLNVDLEASKMAECCARNLVKEVHQRVEELMFEVEQGRESEKSASESLGTVMKKLEESNGLLNDAKSEITVLKEKLSLLESLSEKQKGDLKESEHRLEQAKEETSEMVKKVESLESELEATREERSEALNNEKLAAASLQSLLEEKNKLVSELENSREEEEKSKKALESLASALHEVSSEARDAKEKLLSSQVECDNYERQMEDLKLVLQSSNEKYEGMLNYANKQVAALTDSVEQFKQDYGNLKDELEQKKLALVSYVRKYEEEKSCFENEISKLTHSIEQSKHDCDNLKAELEQKELALVSSVRKYEEEKSCFENEISKLTHSIEQSKHDYDNLKAELEQKELVFVNSVKKSEEENHHMENEKSRLIESLEQSKYDYDSLKTELEQKELDLGNTVKKSEEQNRHMENGQSRLIQSLEQSKHDYDNLKVELEQKELDMLNSVMKSEEEKSLLEIEVNRLLNLLKLAEEESSATRGERDRWNKSFKKADLEAIHLKQVLAETKEESTRLKEGLIEMENQLLKVLEENEDLRRREAASQDRVGELSKSLEEALAKREEEDGDLTDCEKDYDMLPKVVEFSEQNGRGDVRPTAELQSQPKELPIIEKPTEMTAFAGIASEVDNSNDKLKDGEENAESTEVDLKMWESCKIDVKHFSPERETENESFDDELDSKGEGGDLYDHANGVSSTENLGRNSSPPSKSSSQKKKKPLLHKFGSLLKKKSSSTSNHK